MEILPANPQTLAVVKLPVELLQPLRWRVAKNVVIEKLFKAGITPASTIDLLSLYRHDPRTLLIELEGVHSIETISDNDIVVLDHLNRRAQFCVKKIKGKMEVAISEYIREISGDMCVNYDERISPDSVKILALQEVKVKHTVPEQESPEGKMIG